MTVSGTDVKTEPRDTRQETAEVLNNSTPERDTPTAASRGALPESVTIEDSEEEVQLTKEERKEEAEKV